MPITLQGKLIYCRCGSERIMVRVEFDHQTANTGVKSFVCNDCGNNWEERFENFTQADLLSEMDSNSP